MTIAIDKKTVAYLRENGVDLHKMVEGPNSVIDEAELLSIENTLASRPEGLDARAESTLRSLRALSGESGGMIQWEDGLQWAVRVQTGATNEDMATLRKVLGSAFGLVQDVKPADWAKLVAAKGQPGVDAGFLVRIARSEGRIFNGLNVNVVPANPGSLNATDLQFIEDAYAIRPKNGVFDADAYKALVRALTQSEMSPSERDLLRRVEEASRDSVSVEFRGAAVQMDVETPLQREVRGLMSRYNITTFTFPESLSQLATAIGRADQTPATAADLVLLRRIVARDGKSIPVPGATPSQVGSATVNAKITTRDLEWLQQQFGTTPGFSLADGTLDADDIDALDRAMTARLSPAEREIWLARLFAATNAYDVKGPGDVSVKVNPRAATTSDVQAMIDIYGVQPRKGVIGPDHVFQVMEQLRSGEVPRGIAAILDKATQGKPLSAHELTVLKDQLGRRRALLDQVSKTTTVDEGTRTKATQDLAGIDRVLKRLETLDKLPFSPTSPQDAADLVLTRNMFRGMLGVVDMWAQTFEARINSSNGQKVALDATHEVSFNLDAGKVEVEVKPATPEKAPGMSDQAFHDAIIRDSRQSKTFDFRYEAGRYVLTYFRDKQADGDAFLAEAAVRHDGKGGSVRAQWNSNVPISADFWIGAHLGIGAAYDQTTTAIDQVQHRVSVEGRGGVDLRWFMSRRLGMELNVSAGVETRAGLIYTPAVAQNDLQLTKGAVKQLGDAEQKLIDDFGKDVGKSFATLGDLQQPAQDIVDQEMKALGAQLGGLAANRARALLTPGSGDDNAADTAFTTALSQTTSNITSRLKTLLGAKFDSLKGDISAKAEKLASDALDKAQKAASDYLASIVNPVTAGFGLNFTSQVNWTARIPLVSGKLGTLSFLPRVGAYFNMPIVNVNDAQLSTSMRSPLVPTLGFVGEVGLGYKPSEKGGFSINARGGVDAAFALGKGQPGLPVAGYGRLTLDWTW